MPAEIWKDREVAKAFLGERSLLIPDRPRQLEVIHRVVGFHCPKPQRMLDLGSGDAVLLTALMEAFPNANGIAVDFSPLMLEQARRRLGKFGQRATTLEADLQTPEWKESLAGPFSVIVSGFAIHHLPDERKQALYQEIYDLLAAGGVFLNSEHVASTTLRGEQMFDDVMVSHLYQRRKEKGEEVTLEQIRRDFLERPDRAANILALVEDQCRWLREIGFRNVDCFLEILRAGHFRRDKMTFS
jgi:tRNA (cmo5U34)-methyltransferase